MANESGNRPVDWYWPPVDRGLLSDLSRKSDRAGFAQTLGFLAVLATTGTLAWYSAYHWRWFTTLALLFLHGTCWSFVSNALHELSHGSVFATPGLNRGFLAVFSLLSGINPVLFWTSHSEHHKFTMYPANDLEIAPDSDPRLRDFLLAAVVNVRGFFRVAGMTIRHAVGMIRGPWEEHLFPPRRMQSRSPLIRWARILLAVHGALIVIALWLHLWMLPVLITLAPYYGRALQWLCNESQHAGLPGAVPDFRLCCRTIYLNPVLQFMYWHMNYHTEHHLFAAVPCYRLARLHALLKPDLPASPRGLVATWKHIIQIARTRSKEPGYRYFAEVPGKRSNRMARKVDHEAQTAQV